jgi:hypothetical protein
MSSLTDTLKMVNNMIGPPEATRKRLALDRTKLYELLQSHHVEFLDWHEDWHRKLMNWVDDYTSHEPLRQLFLQVSNHLWKACTKLQDLKKWAKAAGSDESLPGGRTDRHVVISALVDIQNAFGEFAVVAWDEKLKSTYMHDSVIECLRTTSRIMLVLGGLLFQDQSEFLDRWEEVNEKSNMKDFKFDLLDDGYGRVPDPTLTGVICDAAETPSTYLPSSSVPPALVRNQGPYWRPILVNRERI